MCGCVAAVTGVQNIFSGPASLGSNQLGRNLLSGELGFGKPSLLVGPGDPIEAREEQDIVAISATSWVYVRGKSWHLLTRSIVRHCRSAAELQGAIPILSQPKPSQWSERVSLLSRKYLVMQVCTE